MLLILCMSTIIFVCPCCGKYMYENWWRKMDNILRMMFINYWASKFYWCHTNLCVCWLTLKKLRQVMGFYINTLLPPIWLHQVSVFLHFYLFYCSGQQSRLFYNWTLIIIPKTKVWGYMGFTLSVCPRKLVSESPKLLNGFWLNFRQW